MTGDLGDRLDRFFRPRPAPPATPRQSLNFARLGGREHDTAAGPTLTIERHYPWPDLPGRGSLSLVLDRGWRPALLDPRCPGATALERVAFIDIETTGLSLGAGTVAFLVGVLHADPDGFLLRQFLLRDFAEETAQQLALAEAMSGYDLVVTYNGGRFDLPVLRSRSVLNRVDAHWLEGAHLDILHPVRTVWHGIWPDCRLATAESRLLGVVRAVDCEGWEVPLRYRQFLQEQNEEPLIDVLEHNAQDLLSLAALTAVLQSLFDPESGDFGLTQAETFGLARALAGRGRIDESIAAFERGRAMGRLTPAYGRAMRMLVRLLKRRGDWEGARAVWLELAAAGEPLERFWAHCEEAKAMEHRRRDFRVAIDAAELAHRALSHLPAGPARGRLERELSHRRERLLRRLKAG